MSGKYRNYLILSLILGMVLTTGSLAAPATDDSAIVALWHMDSDAGGKVSDDDAVTPGRNNDLTFAIAPGAPTITTGGQGIYGEALSFDGINDESQAKWICADTIVIDGWFKPGDISAAAEKSAVSVNNIVLLKFLSSKCYFTAYNKVMPTGTGATLSVAVASNTWCHVIASVTQTGAMTLNVYNADGTLRGSATGNTPGVGGLHRNLTTMSPLWIGDRNSTFYVGLIDDLKISTIKNPTPASDDDATVSLLHMDSAIDGRVSDDDPCRASRNNDLVFSPDPCSPTITTGGQGYYGEALSFDGTQTATFVKKWNQYSTFKAELWIRPFDLGASGDYKYILHIPGQAKLFMKNSTLQFWVRNKANDTDLTLLAPASSVTVGQWNHVVATIEPNGHAVLTTSQNTVSGNTNDGGWYLGAYPRVFTVGGQEGGGGGVANHYNGLIDDLKISSLALVPKSGPTEPQQDDFATYSLTEMDAISTKVVAGETRNVVKDVNTLNPGRHNALILGALAGQTFPLEPTLTTGNGGKFGEALQFNGADNMAWISGWNGSDYLKFEAWVKPYNFDIADYDTRSPMLFCITSGIRLWYRGDTIRVCVRKPDNSGYGPEAFVNVPSGAWDHITLEVLPNGTFTLDSLYGSATGSSGAAGWRHSAVGDIEIGADKINLTTSQWFFEGLIDDMKISDEPTPCGLHNYPIGDFNHDCTVDFADMASMVENWLKCTTPGRAECMNLN